MTLICLVVLMAGLLNAQGETSCVVPNEFEAVYGNYYKFEWTPEPLIEAKRKCNNLGGHVAEFRTKEQLHQLLSFFQTINEKHVWAPIYRFTDECKDQQCQGKLHWLTKPYESQLLYSDLDLTDLDLTKERCALLDKSGKLTKQKCYEGARFICQFDCNNTFSFAQCAQNGNENIYESFGQYIFGKRYQTLTFERAVQFCQDKGGSLLEPRNSSAYQSAAFMASLQATHIGIVNPRYQGDDQMLYVSDGTPVNVSNLGLTANGYKLEGQEKPTFQIHLDGDLDGTKNLKAYFCQITCSSDELSRKQHTCSDGTLVPDNYDLWLGQYYDVRTSKYQTRRYLEYAQHCQLSGGYLIQFRTIEEWKAFLVLRGKILQRDNFDCPTLVKISITFTINVIGTLDIIGDGENLWTDLINFKGSCDTESSCRSKLVWRNDGVPFNGVQDDQLSFDLNTNECVAIHTDLHLTSKTCTSNMRSVCHFICDSMPRSDQCDGARVKDKFFRFNKKFWIAESPSGSKSPSTMQKACQGHNASLIAIKSEDSFEEARALSNLLNNGNNGMIVGLFREPGNQTWIDGTPFEDTRDVFTQGVDIDKPGSVAVVLRNGKLESSFSAYQGVCASDCPVYDALPECLANAVGKNDSQIREILPPKAVYKAQETRRFDECRECLKVTGFACLNVVRYSFR